MTCKLATILTLALLLVPAAQALPDEATYNLATFSMARDNPASGQLHSRSIGTDPLHGDASNVSYAILGFSYSANSGGGSAGAWQYTATWDNVAIPDCLWNVETPTSVGATTVYHRAIWCRLEAVQLGGSHILNLTRTTLSGTPAAISHETLSYRLDRTDLDTFDNLQAHREHTLEISMHDNNFGGVGFDGLLGILVLATIAWVAFTRGLQLHPAWSGMFLPVILGFFTIVVGDDWPEIVQLPWPWAVLACFLWLLLMYGIAGMGFLTSEWARRRKERDEGVSS